MSQQDFYKRFVATLRAIDPRRPNRLCEKLLNEHPGDFYLPEGAAFSNAFLTRVENIVSRAMHDKAAKLRAQADEIERAARKFDRESAARRFDVRTAEIKDINDYAEAFANDWCEKNVIGWKKEAA